MTLTFNKYFENHSDVDTYSEENWDNYDEQKITSRYNIYLCVRDNQDFAAGHVYIVVGINQNVIGPNIVDTRVKVKGLMADEYINIDFNAGEDPYRRALANGSLIYIGKLDEF
jgi:hypothetical protein